MPRSTRRARRIVWLACGAATAIVPNATFAADPTNAADAPATISHRVPEEALSTLSLTPEAVDRLGIRTTNVSRQRIARTRSVGGIITTPPGGTIQIVAPSEGTVLVAAGHDLPVPGTAVHQGQPLLRLLSISPAELARAREVAEIAAARVTLAEGVEDAPGELQAARSALVAARRRVEILSGGGGRAAEELEPMTLAAPVDGVVQSLGVSAGQAVATGALLFELVRIDPVWVRVPLYAGDAAAVRADAAAGVRALSERPAAARPARVALGPPSANPTAASVDLHYSLSNADAAFRIGERVLVDLVMGPDSLESVVPFAAVVYDIHGGTWVYEQTEATTYSRRRVLIAFVHDGLAVLAQGPAPGAAVVTTGASELFGTEFGIGK